jgi:hypothetical protein
MSQDFTPDRIKHLEMIQAVVNRLAGNSFLVKGWAITVAGALFGFALTAHKGTVALVAAVPILAFWLLDTYFLRAERLFRALYDEVRLKDDRVQPFFLGATGAKFVGRVRAGETRCEARKAASWPRCATSVTMLILYVGLLLVTGLVAAVAFLSSPSREQDLRHHDRGRFHHSHPHHR